MRYILLCLCFVAACAAITRESLQRTSTAEVCYIGMTQPEHRQMVDTELQRRKADCKDHMAEIRAIESSEARASSFGQGVGEGTPRPTGGMGRY
jgi:hypothetical protein